MWSLILFTVNVPIPCFSIKAMRSASVNRGGGEVSLNSIYKEHREENYHYIHNNSESLQSVCNITHYALNFAEKPFHLQQGNDCLS